MIVAHRVVEIAWRPRSRHEWQTFGSCRREAARLWNEMSETAYLLRCLNWPWMTRREWEGWSKGMYPLLHSQSVQEIIDEFIEALVLDLYRQGLSSRAIAETTGVPKSTAARWLLAAGVSRDRSTGQIYGCRRQGAIPCDWSFRPLTPEKAWLLGLIFGDGSLRKERTGFVVTSGDRDIMENISRLFDSRLNIRSIGNYWQVDINSVRLFTELAQWFGLTPNKAATLAYPTLAAADQPHFIRGLLDSDGCWSLDERSAKPLLRFSYVSMSGGFVVSLRDQLIRAVGLSPNRHANQSANGVFTLAYSNRDALKLGEWLYRESSAGMRGDRKYQRWLSQQ